MSETPYREIPTGISGEMTVCRHERRCSDLLRCLTLYPACAASAVSPASSMASLSMKNFIVIKQSKG